MSKLTRLLLVEDHAIVREGLRMLLDQDPELQIVGEAGDGIEALRCVEKLQPDLVLLDLSMPKMNGLEALKEINRMAPDVKVLALTGHKTEEYVHAALRAGASGYILKDSTSTELLLAVRSVLSGKQYISACLVEQGISGDPGAGGTAYPSSPLDQLSSRERETLKLIAEGNRNREVGDALCISEKTVEKHRASLMRKLNFRNVQELTAYAIEKGLINR